MTRLVVLISCSKRKRVHNSLAENMYISLLFKRSLEYAKSLNPDKILIMSAKYYLLPLDREISPYNVTLNDMPVEKVKKWAGVILEQLRKEFDLKNDKFVMLAGDKYVRFLRDALTNKEEPLRGLPIGQRLKFLKSKL